LQRQIADLVQDEEVGARYGAHEHVESVLLACHTRSGHQFVEAQEIGSVSTLDGLERKRDRQVRLAHAAGAEEEHVLALTPSLNWSGHLGEVMLNLFEEEENGGISQGRRWAPAVHDRLQEGADRPRPPGRDYAFGACA